MAAELLLRDASIVEGVLSLAALTLLVGKGLVRQFSCLTALLSVQALSIAIMVPLLFFRRLTGLDINTAYTLYFYSMWLSSVAQAGLLVACIYQLYRDAMRPLQGLQQIGKVIFRWVAAVAIIVSAAIALAPYATASSVTSTTRTMEFVGITGQIQQATNVLSLCLLLFVCFAIRPLGLTYRSRIFGVSLGLGFMSVSGLVQTAWFSVTGTPSLYSPIYLVGIAGSLVAFCIWGSYFALPEPRRELVLLPTTSPFFTWNRISEALGDEPGFVAVAGFKPDMLASAELKVLSSGINKSKVERLPAPSVEPATHHALQSIAVSQ
jgi:hypothetical protein